MIKVVVTIFLTISAGVILRYNFDSDTVNKIELQKIYHQKFKAIGESEEIILGDSRALNGLSPKYLAENTINFAFSSNSYTRDYLSYVNKHIGKKIKRIYIGVTIQSLTDYNLSSDFKKQLKSPWRGDWFNYFEKLLLRPMNLWSIQAYFKQKPKRYYYRGYFSLSDKEISNSASYAYKNSYRGKKFKVKYIDNLIYYTKLWRDKNIDVIFIKMPSRADQFDYDKSISGVSLEELNSYFNKNGIKLHQYKGSKQLKYVDGDHLIRSSGNEFTKWVSSLRSPSL